MQRRFFLTTLLSGAAALLVASTDAEAGLFDNWGKRSSKPRQARVTRKASAHKTIKARKVRISNHKRPRYQGRETVNFASAERPGTIVIKTGERALYYVLGSGKAVRYGVAVGKQGFSWSGTARVGMKAVNPRWTPPPEMIARTPKYAKWAGGMPGGIPENPLGARAIYLFNRGGDTGFRIHGTNAPSSIGTAASSGCIRMLNHEVTELYGKVRIGARVIVI